MPRVLNVVASLYTGMRTERVQKVLVTLFPGSGRWSLFGNATEIEHVPVPVGAPVVGDYCQ